MLWIITELPMLQVINEGLALISFIYFLSIDRIDVLLKLFIKGCNDLSIVDMDIHVFFWPQCQNGCKICKCINRFISTLGNML